MYMYNHTCNVYSPPPEDEATIGQGQRWSARTKVVLVQVVSRMIDYFHVRIYICLMKLMVCITIIDYSCKYDSNNRILFEGACAAPRAGVGRLPRRGEPTGRPPRRARRPTKRSHHPDSLRGSSANIGAIQIRLAWPLRKDDTHKSRSENNRCPYVQKGVITYLTCKQSKGYAQKRVVACPLLRFGGHSRRDRKELAILICNSYIYIYVYTSISTSTSLGSPTHLTPPTMRFPLRL